MTFLPFLRLEKQKNMDKEGRIIRMFVPDKEISETQALLEGTDMEIADYYRRAFELGKKAAKAQMQGKKVTIEGEGIEGFANPQEEQGGWGSMASWPPQNGFELSTQKVEPETPSSDSNVRNLNDYRNK